MKKVIVATLTAMIATSPVFASSFTGPRAELHAGWDHLSAKYKYSDTDFPEDDLSVKRSKDGVVYGVGLGYDFAASESLRAGILVNFDLSDTRKCGELYGLDELCFKAKRDIEVGARLGQVYGDKTMVYIGVSYVNGRGRFQYTDFEDILDNFSIARNRAGIRINAGAEVALSGGVYGKLEYRYSDYKNFKYRDGTETESLGFDRHQVLTGVGVRF